MHFPPQSTSINTSTSSAVFTFFPKKSCLWAFLRLWLSFAENILYCCVSGWQRLFHPSHKCIVQSTEKEESGEEHCTPQDGQLFHLQKEESVFWNPSLKWETLCSGYRKNSSGVQAMPHSDATLPSKGSLCNTLCIWPWSNLSSPAPVKIWTHSAVYLWDFMVLRDTDSYRNAG